MKIHVTEFTIWNRYYLFHISVRNNMNHLSFCIVLPYLINIFTLDWPPSAGLLVSLIRYLNNNINNLRRKECKKWKECVVQLIVKKYNIILLCTHLYHTSFLYLSITCNAFIACYIRCKKYLISWKSCFCHSRPKFFFSPFYSASPEIIGVKVYHRQTDKFFDTIYRGRWIFSFS